MYKEWLHCSLLHADYELLSWKVLEAPESRYAPPFKEHKAMYPGSIIIRIVFKLNQESPQPQNHDDLVPIRIAALVLRSDGSNKAVTKMIVWRMNKTATEPAGEKLLELSSTAPTVTQIATEQHDWYATCKQRYQLWYKFIICLLAVLSFLLMILSLGSLAMVLRIGIIAVCSLLPLYQPTPTTLMFDAILASFFLVIGGMMMLAQGMRDNRYAFFDRMVAFLMIIAWLPLLIWWLLPISGII